MEEVSAFLVQYGSLVLFSVVFAEQIGLPLPAIPVLLAAGALAGGIDAWREREFPLEATARQGEPDRVGAL